MRPTTALDRATRGYRPIHDYGLIGDCHGAALVARDGGIDWACLGRLDAAPIFARILDAENGGFFSVAPTCRARITRRYVEDSAVLSTRITCSLGSAEVLDFMPVGRRRDAGSFNYVALDAPNWIVRLVRGKSGRVPLRACYRPAPHLEDLASLGSDVFDREAPPPTSSLHATVPMVADGDAEVADFAVSAGERHAFIVAASRLARQSLLADAERMLATTRSFWQEWCELGCYPETYAAPLRRSAVTLKLLTFAPTGAIIAAPITSLPESVGGVRNWDYRFSWLRDASWTLLALQGLGHAGEANRFVGFLRDRHLRKNGVQVLYGARGERVLTERVVSQFEGYRGSGPVRVGNAAHSQLQLDVYGETLDLAWIYSRMGGRFDRAERISLRYLADQAATRWREPDDGIWEDRGQRRQFVHSKMMCWVALDRAARIFGAKQQWIEAGRDIVQTVIERGVHRDGHLVRTFGGTGTDVALLAASWLGFPAPEAVVTNTIRAVVHELRDGAFLRRYCDDDSLEGKDSPFLAGSFWLVRALLHVGLIEDATRLFEQMLAIGSDLGLYAEEIDPHSGLFLGNYPQGLVHVGLITAGLAIDHYHRHGRSALDKPGASFWNFEPAAGPGAIYTIVKQAIRRGHLVSSPFSVMRLP